MVVLHGVELLMLLKAAGITGRYARAHPGHGAGLPWLVVLLAFVVVGWQACRLLRGRRSLNVSGLAVQAGILMASIAVATQNVAGGVTGIVLACAILAGWGHLGLARRFTGSVAASVEPAPEASASRRASVGGVVLAVLTVLLVLLALSVRSQIIFGIVVLAVIFVPLERLFALHPRRVLRRGWRTDLVHYLVNGTALRIGLLVSVVVVGGVLRVFVPAPLRDGIAASPSWVQIVAGLSIAMIGGYAGHRMAHEVPLLWRFHRVHHSIREMDWLAANHLHPLDETFIRSVAVLPLYALGFGRVTLGAFIVVITLQAIFIHANVRFNFGWLRWVIATPQYHHWHHAREPQAYNSNYAGEFPILDALFGTLYLPASRWPAQYGVDDTEPEGYLRQLAWPFRRNYEAA
ncbi:sterol desaturase family protein [Mycobacterium sp.]|uniref:sterol desaturase family protein n=1 Tax=Mycobacterium sp. TaxID=1785 RepID=UPI002C58840A|nr:sterol desaturase family protein [Mycobacterium sp.]HTQ16687.1 sterol desaturase family protein [Mycobacterium sp.]